MLWRLTIKEFGPELIYLPRDKNVVADSLSRLHWQNLKKTDSRSISYGCAEHFALNENDFPPHAHPLSYSVIRKHQQNGANLINTAKKDSTYVLKEFQSDDGLRTLVCLNNKIVIPKTLQKHLVQWYHTFLCHPGKTRTEQTIRQHFTWGGLTKMVKNVCASCHTCQITKKKW